MIQTAKNKFKEAYKTPFYPLGQLVTMVCMFFVYGMMNKPWWHPEFASMSAPLGTPWHANFVSSWIFWSVFALLIFSTWVIWTLMPILGHLLNISLVALVMTSVPKLFLAYSLLNTKILTEGGNYMHGYSGYYNGDILVYWNFFMWIWLTLELLVFILHMLHLYREKKLCQQTAVTI